MPVFRQGLPPAKAGDMRQCKKSRIDVYMTNISRSIVEGLVALLPRAQSQYPSRVPVSITR